MNTRKMFFAIGLVLAGIVSSNAQTLNSSERRALREYTAPDELVSISPSAPLDRALSAISEVSKKFTGKIIIDPERRTAPVGVDITGMYWRSALETICRKMNLWYEEYPTYYQIIALGKTDGKNQEAGGGAVGNVEIQKEVANINSREVKISAVFFEVSLTKLQEAGINWSFMKSNKDMSLNSSFAAADKVSDGILSVAVTPKLSFANITAVAKVFSSYNLGEVLSGPQLIVRSGEKGRIQVGQDFSIKERDFSGNLLDKFYSTGTIIDVRPQVITNNGTNFVRLVVDVERSSLVPSAGSNIVNKTKASTDVLLLDNEETIIGGLYNNETSEVRVGIPILKDLPWYVFGLRYLFGYNKDEIRKKELIILLKAELVPTLQDRIAQKVKEDNVYQRWQEEVHRQAEHVTGKGGDR